jgi:acyl dehydratase
VSTVTTISSRELVGAVGRSFCSDYSITVTQELVWEFAATTGASHWMHTDPQRATASPLGRPTVQGLLTLALGAHLEPHVLAVEAADAVFYGFDRVRFPAPLFVGDDLRLEIEVVAVEVLGDGVQATTRRRFWSAVAKPVCVADEIVRYRHAEVTS